MIVLFNIITIFK
ncbi:hypothetical protein YPPY14_2022, partial [Yersinia pestis PY-14]